MEQGRRIALLRKKKGLSQEELGNRIGLQQSAVSKLETGRRRLSAEEAREAAIALAVPVERLLSGNGFDHS